MKNKKILLSLAGTLVVVGALMAADNLGQYTDAVKQINGSRWQLFRGASTANVATATLNFTNVVSTLPGIVAKVVWVPGNVGDQIELHNTTTTTGCTVANEIFVDNSVTNSTTGPVVGYPQTFEFASNNSGALNATSGITAVIKPANTSVVSRVFILYDQNR